MSLATLVFLAFLAQGFGARVVTLVLPHTLRTGETVSVEVKIGVIQRGAEIEITTTSGRFLGVISPYGIRSGSEGGIYAVPLPADAILNDRVSLRLSLNQYGEAKRSPTKDEVRNIRLKITGTVH